MKAIINHLSSLALLLGLTIFTGCDFVTPPDEDKGAFVWRLQVRTHTSDVNHAGSDAKVFVRLNGGGTFWLDLGGSDRDRNETNIYDVLLLNDKGESIVQTMNDIESISFGTRGNDRWIFDRVEILVNNPFDRNASREQTAPYVIADINGEFEISTKPEFSDEIVVASGDELRGSLWNTDGIRGAILVPPIVPRAGIGIRREVLEEILESVLGDMMGPGNDLASRKWGKKEGRQYVGVHHKNRHAENEASIDIDIHPSRIADVDVDIRLSCDAEDKLQAEILSVDISTSRLLSLLIPGLNKILDRVLEGMFQGLFEHPQNLGDECSNPRFTENHDLLL